MRTGPHARRPAAALLVATALFAVTPAFPAAADASVVRDAEAFMSEAEARLRDLWVARERAFWVQSTYITQDTERIAADANQALMAATVDYAKRATRFDGVELPAELSRKMRLLKTSLSLVAPEDPEKRARLSELAASMEGMYARGTWCRTETECLDLTELSKRLAESRDPDELLAVWKGWREISRPIRPMYSEFVGIANEGARGLGFHDLGDLWRSGYDLPPAAFASEVERLWNQLKPLYESLHCYVRARLREAYGPEVVPEGAPIPAHLLGNMWAQSWGNVYDLVRPASDDRGYDLTELLRSKGVEEIEMVRYGERFFTSLGFEPLPETFWERSMFVKPRDRDVVCHASAWDVDSVEDLRLKMCIQITEEDFSTIHHELGHNVYQRAYAGQSYLHAESANDGFHEGIGDTIALSVTPEYLVEIGLLEELPEASGDIGYLLRMALDKIAFVPFGLLVDQWRWKVFSGEVGPENYNAAWWKLRERYQGVASPVPRSEADFDPGAKYHVAANVPYTRYFLAHILQFQFHRALCREAGFEGPLHRCSIYGDAEAGAKLIRMLEMGRSKPWPDELEAVTGERDMDAMSVLDYFAPLRSWLDEQNAGQTCGW